MPLPLQDSPFVTALGFLVFLILLPPSAASNTDGPPLLGDLPSFTPTHRFTVSPGLLQLPLSVALPW